MVEHVITPKVLDVARRDFNCKNLSGVPLEDDPTGGIMGAFWEVYFVISSLCLVEHFVRLEKIREEFLGFFLWVIFILGCRLELLVRKSWEVLHGQASHM